MRAAGSAEIRSAAILSREEVLRSGRAYWALRRSQDIFFSALALIVLLPLIAGLAYELFRLPLKFPNSKLVKALVAPGLAMQRLTTREPDLDQLAVAIAALKAVPEFGIEPTEDTAAASNGTSIQEELLPVDENNPAFSTPNPDTEHA